MVFYAPKRLRQSRRATDGKITDLPDELLLCILEHVEPLDFLRFRLTCRTFAPAGTSAITGRMKKLYLSPSRSSLLAAVDICRHPEFSFSIEQVVLLGSEPQRETHLVRSGPRRVARRVHGEYLLTWPTSFPTASKISLDEEASPTSATFCDVYEPLLSALATLPRLKKLSFATRVSRSRPGLNQVKQSSLDSFPKRHIGKLSSSHKRWSDGYALLAIVAALEPRIEDFVFPSLLRAYEDFAETEFSEEGRASLTISSTGAS